MNHTKIVILGAGPCGLGAAWRLSELGSSNWQIFDRCDTPGGLAASFTDEQGFTWDIGGHVQFSHYDYFDNVMHTAIPPEEWLNHQRESWVWMRQTWIPYPLQYNIGLLPEAEMLECLQGLMACSQNGKPSHAHFGEWIMRTFGEGIANHFLYPYNYKVWAYPPEDMSSHWVGERVAVPDVQRVVNNIVTKELDCSWGPNNTFQFPLHGGTGQIWRNVAGLLPEGHLTLDSEVVRVDTQKKRVSFSDSREESYDVLINTMALDSLLAHSDMDAADDAERFVYSASNIFGIGLRGNPPEHLKNKCWMYFSEDDCPFYRVTVFSNYSPNNVPKGDYWSLMAEVSESPKKPVNHATLMDEVVQGMLNTKLIAAADDVVATWSYRAEHGYPTPFLGRDELLEKFQPELKRRGVYSRGRFGAWKYEASNQDHSFMQGVEAVDNALFGTPEMTFDHPEFVNTHRIR